MLDWLLDDVSDGEPKLRIEIKRRVESVLRAIRFSSRELPSELRADMMLLAVGRIRRRIDKSEVEYILSH